MRKFSLILVLLNLFLHVLGIEGNDDNVTRDYYVQMFKTQPYVQDFDKTFSTPEDRGDYKKLREYLNRKLEIERVLRLAGDEYYYGLFFSRLFAEDYVQSLEDEIRFRDAEEEILLRINSAMPNLNFNGRYTVAFIESDILPVIRERYRKAIEIDSINQRYYTRIQENLEGVKQDVFLCEQALNAALSPEFQQQSFRIWISLTFSLLIAVLLCVFFYIIFRRSNNSLARLLLNDTGLQFITIFVLIIAIILFGILNILGGSELAAILSGISGYILGKGGQAKSGKPEPEYGMNVKIDKEPPGDAIEEVVAMPDLLSEDAAQQGEKYFPGEVL